MPDKLVMTTHLAEVPVEIYERTQMVMAGAVMAPMVVECYYVLPAPSAWPKVQIRARRGLARLWYQLVHRTGIMFEYEAFNKAFKVTSKDEEFAILLLNTDLQSFILEKTNVDWSAGNGSIKLWYRGKFRKKRIDQSLDRLARFESLIADELFEFDLAHS